MQGGYANVASATGTRTDSAAKHQIPVRVSFEHMLSWTGNDQVTLQKEKMAFCMHKDDMVIGISRPYRKNEHSKTSMRNKAYPSIVTTLGRMDLHSRNYLIALLHNPVFPQDRDRFVKKLEYDIDHWHPNMLSKTKKQIQEMPQFFFCGVSVGMAFAHPNSGDNVASSMIGGLITVTNGAFPIDIGDTVQWYWDCERQCFDEDGFRRDEMGDIDKLTSDGVSEWLNRSSVSDSSGSSKRRKIFDRGNGIFAGTSSETNIVFNGKANVAFPKSYRPDTRYVFRVGDTDRTFGKAMQTARPYEQFDILIGRQSM